MVDFDSITLRQLVDCLSNYFGNAPVHFTPFEELDKTFYISCHFMGNEEADALRKNVYSRDVRYNNCDVGIHIPDVTICQFFLLEKQRNPAAQKVIYSELAYNKRMYVKEQHLWFALFCILHEIGHWKHFMNSGLSAIDYEESEHSIREYFEKYGDEIRKIPDIFYAQKVSCAEKYHIDSHEQIPSEKAADEYALQHFDDALKAVREALGYDEEWLSAHW